VLGGPDVSVTPTWSKGVVEQHPWIKEWCVNNPGRILYGEVIGDQKGYPYGLKPGEVDFYAFDIWEPTETWTKPWDMSVLPVVPANRCVPILYQGPVDLDIIKKLTDGKSALDTKTQREGVVISEQSPAPEGIRRPRQVKRVSNVFLEGDSK
jgi:ATP-dependent RNA circularization protein (DNA/RNA ligase family)